MSGPSESPAAAREGNPHADNLINNNNGGIGFPVFLWLENGFRDRAVFVRRWPSTAATRADVMTPARRPSTINTDATTGSSNDGRNATAHPRREPNVPEAHGMYPTKSPVAMSLVSRDARRSPGSSSPGRFDAFIEGSKEFPVVEQICDAGSNCGERDEQHHAEQHLAVHEGINPAAESAYTEGILRATKRIRI